MQSFHRIFKRFWRIFLENDKKILIWKLMNKRYNRFGELILIHSSLQRFAKFFECSLIPVREINFWSTSSGILSNYYLRAFAVSPYRVVKRPKIWEIKKFPTKNPKRRPDISVVQSSRWIFQEFFHKKRRKKVWCENSWTIHTLKTPSAFGT